MSITLVKCLNRYRNIIKEPWYNLTTYSTGTVAVTLASATVTGTSTVWATNAKAGETFHIALGQYYHILSVNSDTSITLTENYAGVTSASSSYTIRGGRTTDATAVDDLNAAEHQIVDKIATLDEGYFGITGTISYVSGTERYLLPTTNGTMKKVVLVTRTDTSDQKVLHPTIIQERNKYVASSGTTDVNNLREYYYLFGLYIGIVPVPTTTATNNITIYGIQQATGFTTEASTTILPDDFMDLLCLTAATLRTPDELVQKKQAELWNLMITTVFPRQIQEGRSVKYNEEAGY